MAQTWRRWIQNERKESKENDSIKFKVLAGLADRARVICGQWEDAKRTAATYRRENGRLKSEIDQVAIYFPSPAPPFGIVGKSEKNSTEGKVTRRNSTKAGKQQAYRVSIHPSYMSIFTAKCKKTVLACIHAKSGG